MGLLAYVYRNADPTWPDCSMNGWSSQFTQVCVTNAEGPFEPSPEHPAVLVRKHRTMDALHVVSQADLDSGKWTMFGGNYLSCSDSRFSNLCRELLKADHRAGFGALSIHDRIE